MSKLNCFGIRVFLIFPIFLSCFLVFSQTGNNDLTFNPNDLGFGFGDGASFTVLATDTLPDGKIMIAGAFTSYNGTSITRLARLHPDGSLDETFNPGLGPNNVVYAMAVQSDGKVIIGGLFTTYNGLSQPRIARINTDGSIDNTFNINGGAGVSINAIAIQPDGKILIGGGFTTYGGLSRNRILRLNADGTVDTSFAIGTGANGTVHTILLQPDGKVIIGGEFTSYNGTTRNRIARLNSNGSYDASFLIGTGANNFVYTCYLQSDGKIIIGGTFTSYGVTTINRIARLNTDGTLDGTFTVGTGIIGSSDSVLAFAVQSDNKIILGGNFTSFNGNARSRVLRLNANGTLDETFDVGTGLNNLVYGIKIQAGNKILLVGAFSAYNGNFCSNIVRLNANASFDLSFNSGSGANAQVQSCVVLADGKMLLAGSFSKYNGIQSEKIVRINADGSIDQSFSANVSGPILSMAVQTDGKLIIAGQFTSVDGVTRNRIARLNTNGSLDISFNPGTGASNTVRSVVLQSDGKILIGGTFTTVNSTQRNRVARLNTDGSLDATFLSAAISSNTGANNEVNAIVLQPDGQVLIGGSFTSFNGTTRNRIARLNTNGTLDTSFSPGSGFGAAVWALALQSDNKIIAGGQFFTFNSIGRLRLARLNTNGSLDTSFVPGESADNTIFALAIEPSGKIVLGGQFSVYQNVSRNSIARVNTDGAIDASFDPGTGANAEIRSLTFDQDGNLMAGGSFTSYNNVGRNRITRISGDCLVATSTDFINSATPITWIDGNTYTESNNTATFTIVGGATNGCDSIVTLHLNIVSALQYELTASNGQICAGDEVVLAVNLLGANYPAGYVHCNPSNPTQVVDVTNPTTGKTWMDRNLGANRAAISSTDSEAYGSLFQWGRFADGHQCVNRFSGDGVTTSGTTSTISATATPSHGSFIAVNNAQWQSPTVNNLWQGVDGINNPCPAGYRLPTEAELESERLSWQQAPINSTNDIVGGFASPLKFTMGGRRNNSNGGLSSVGSYGAYWSSTALAWEEISLDLIIGVTFPASVEWNHNRSMAVSVRCIKN
jgi:uncharacterized delta-60 repeat protein